MSTVTLNQLAKFLHGKGLTNNHAIAGIAGNIKIESNSSTTALNKREGAIGLCQWEGGRRTGLKKLAKKRGKTETDAQTQLEWLWIELTTHDPYQNAVYPALRNATSAADAATVWDAHFEVSDGSTRQKRIDAANQFYSQLDDSPAPKPSPKPSPKPAPDTGNVYVVQKGDTLSGIASHYRLTWQQLYTLNASVIGHDPDVIKPGQKLVLPNTRGESGRYIVQKGDTLSGIASKHGLPSWHSVYDANRGVIGSDPDHIEPGQTLVIP